MKILTFRTNKFDYDPTEERFFFDDPYEVTNFFLGLAFSITGDRKRLVKLRDFLESRIKLSLNSCHPRELYTLVDSRGANRIIIDTAEKSLMFFYPDKEYSIEDSRDVAKLFVAMAQACGLSIEPLIEFLNIPDVANPETCHHVTLHDIYDTLQLLKNLKHSKLKHSATLLSEQIKHACINDISAVQSSCIHCGLEWHKRAPEWKKFDLAEYASTHIKTTADYVYGHKNNQRDT